jgi:hypothetical protein
MYSVEGKNTKILSNKDPQSLKEIVVPKKCECEVVRSDRGGSVKKVKKQFTL